VALSRKLKDIGIFVSPIDIIQTDAIDRLALKCEVTDSRSSQPRNPEQTQWLDSFHQELVNGLDIAELKLTEDDELQVTGATALQAGMLSQVSNVFLELYIWH
jgi:hypothetical protein